VNRLDLRVLILFVALAAIFFAPVLFTERVLVPFDNLYQFPPWSAFAGQLGIGNPHNALVSDLVLENYAWKHFIVESLSAREMPLWNPYVFAGVPFLAAGQHSAMYPFSALFYILPAARAYGYFEALQFVVAMLTMFWFMRVIGLSPFSSIVGAIVYTFSGFFLVSTAFPMVLSAAAWLPGILACVERILSDDRRRIQFAIVGSLLLGIQFLAGHAEISVYNLVVTAYYAAVRLLTLTSIPPLRFASGALVSLRARGSLLLTIGAMAGIGIMLGAVQLLPLYEVLRDNFRVGSVSYETVISYAYPLKQIATFLMPDFFGNPTHHAYFDVFDFSFHLAPSGTIFWGTKNYVEAGAYVGILPLLLAFIGIIASLKPRVARHGSHVLLFALLALISLLFTFGTPLYAILFFGVPGFNQLHTPFRWIYPYTLSVAVLAGIGAEIVSENLKAGSERPGRAWRMAHALPITFGVLILILLSITYIARDAVLTLLDRVVRASSAASQAFDSGSMFYSYEFRNVFLFAILLIGSGAVVRISRCPIYLPHWLGGHPLWKPVAILFITVDLFVLGIGFYSAVDPRLAELVPPSVKFLQQDITQYRVTSYDQRGGPEEKVFNPNVAMFFDISDIRGYDSIIPKQYADYMSLLAPQDELQFNRIAPIYSPEPFDSPLFNLLNVKYVLTARPLPNSGYTLVYDGEIKIYRNDRVLPRAFMAPQARVITDRETLLQEMKRFDPAREVLIEEHPTDSSAQACPYNPISIEKYAGNQVIIKSSQVCSGWLVLSDSYSPGWLAQIDEGDTHLYRADLNFRAVFVPAGDHTIRFKYSPISLRAGAIASFLGVMALVLGAAYLLWQRFYRAESSSQVQVVAKNSLLPMATSLLMKLITLAFAFLSLRILGPTGTGRYAFAVTVWYFADTVTDFGLGILLTREVSRDRSKANSYLFNSAVLRTILWGATLVPIALVAGIYLSLFNMTLDTATTLGLLIIGTLPSNLAASFAYLFNAFERFEFRIAVDFAMRLVNVALSVVALVLGFGIIGLAAVSIITNVITLGIFYLLVQRSLFKPHFEIDRRLIRWMFFESYPLMINNFLSSLFFRIDVLILQPLKGDTVLGYYSTAYKFIDALNFIPSNFTLAIFPSLSRLASSAKDAMLRAYILSLKILLWIALPITVGTIFVAHDLVQFIGGEAYLPDSAIALQVLIWFLPFSFINSVTHYVLIALDQQRFLTKAFVIGVLFNVIANLVAIPPLSYIGASVVTILSEIALLVPFYIGVRRNLASIPFISIAWRPAVASSAMGIALWWTAERIGLPMAIPLSGLLYMGLLIALGALGEDERELLRKLVPLRFHRAMRIEAK
jgi:O-antigen/teichoic acid export membrane protein